jgi:hypothetical protein
MKTSSNSPTSALRQDRTPVVALLKRTIALGGRVLTPAPATGEVLLVGVAIVLGLSLGLATSRAHAAEPSPASDAGALLLQSHAFVTGVSSFEMEQTKVEKMTPFVAGRAVAPARERTESSVMRVVNGNPMLTEMVTKDASGLPLRAIRRGEVVVMKLGDQPWQIASGAYAQFKEQLATPYACPLPHTGDDSPQWRFASPAQEQGQACDVIETVGDSAIGYVTGVMNKTMASATADPAMRPVVRVLSYDSRHWIARSDARRLRVEQAGRMQITMRQPTGQTINVELETTGTTIYRHYGEVAIEVPSEAARLLATPAAKS